MDPFLMNGTSICIPVEITLPPEKIDNDYHSHMMNLIKEKYENKCVSNYGYIILIQDIVRILADEIGTMIPFARVVVEVSCIIFAPRVGMEFRIPIHIILTHGIFIHVERIRILIPMKQIEHEWELHKSSMMFHYLTRRHDHQGRQLKAGDEIRIRLINIRFEKHGYLCIADLVDDDDDQLTPANTSDPEFCGQDPDLFTSQSLH